MDKYFNTKIKKLSKDKFLLSYKEGKSFVCVVIDLSARKVIKIKHSLANDRTRIGSEPKPKLQGVK